MGGNLRGFGGEAIIVRKLGQIRRLKCGQRGEDAGLRTRRRWRRLDRVGVSKPWDDVQDCAEGEPRHSRRRDRLNKRGASCRGPGLSGDTQSSD